MTMPACRCRLLLDRVGVIGITAALILVIGAPAADAQGAGDRPKRIALWGSSVPNGTGDETNQGATPAACAICSNRVAGR